MGKDSVFKWLDSLLADESTQDDKDIVDYLKRLVKADNKAKTDNVGEWENYFETLWKIYPKKVDKILAKKTFEHKIRGLNKEDCKTKSVMIYNAEIKYVKQIEENGTELQYVKNFSSWLNANVPNSKNYKGR